MVNVSRNHPAGVSLVLYLSIGALGHRGGAHRRPGWSRESCGLL